MCSSAAIHIPNQEWKFFTTSDIESYARRSCVWPYRIAKANSSNFPRVLPTRRRKSQLGVPVSMVLPGYRPAPGPFDETETVERVPATDEPTPVIVCPTCEGALPGLCCSCGRELAEADRWLAPNPYHHEINDDDSLHAQCQECAQQFADEI